MISSEFHHFWKQNIKINGHLFRKGKLVCFISKSINQRSNHFNLKNIHKEIKFSDFCKVLEAIHEIKRTKRDGKHLKDKERILKGYVEAFKNFKGKFTEQNGSDSVRIKKIVVDLN